MHFVSTSLHFGSCASHRVMLGGRAMSCTIYDMFTCTHEDAAGAGAEAAAPPAAACEQASSCMCIWTSVYVCCIALHLCTCSTLCNCIVGDVVHVCACGRNRIALQWSRPCPSLHLHVHFKGVEHCMRMQAFVHKLRRKMYFHRISEE